MRNELPVPANVRARVAEVLAAGEQLRASLHEEHELSIALELAPPDSNLSRRFQLARETTQDALSAYNEAVRNCALVRADSGPLQPRPSLWARLAAALTINNRCEHSGLHTPTPLR